MTWRAPFERYIEYIEQLDDLIKWTCAGTARVRMMPELYAALDDERTELNKDQREHRERAQRLADLAKREEKRDFPLVHGHALIALHGALEVLAEDLAVAW